MTVSETIPQIPPQIHRQDGSGNFAVTLFENQKKKPLAKTIALGADGKLVKGVAAQMGAGKFRTLEFGHIDDFANMLVNRRYGVHHALAYGRASQKSGAVASEKALAEGRASGSAITRTAEHFAFGLGEPAVMFIDIDPVPGLEHDAFGFDRLLCQVAPWLKPVRRWYFSSGSSAIYSRHTGELLSPKKAYHLHFVVSDGTKIRAIGETLFAALFDVGYGCIVHSKSGQRLQRTIIDRAVWQAERLDFAFGAVLGEGLESRPEIIPMGIEPFLDLDEVQLVDFAKWQKSSPVLSRLLREAEPEEKRVKDVWIGERIGEAAAKGMPREKAERIYRRAAHHLELSGDFQLHTIRGATSVAAMLAEPEHWHGVTMADPLEPEYGGGSMTMAKAFLVGQSSFPVINSNAHGGISYRLLANENASTKKLRTRRAKSTEKPKTAEAPPIRTDDVRQEKAGEPTSSSNIALEFSEEALALAFAEKHRKHLRYVSKWGSWLHFNGKQWQKEETLLAYDLIRADCREAAQAADEKNPRLKAELNKARTRSAVETLVRSDRRIAATTAQWDSDDWLLNTPAGIIDLKTGENIGNDPHRYMTKITTVAPRGNCRKWLRFLNQVTDGDEELQAYLKRVTGYMLTGSVREHAMFFVYGVGGNGKGTFLGHVGRILGAYHVESPAETFAEKKGERHPTELARLDGARFVLSQETEQGQYWAEARIKSLTGGDIITARFMRGDFFEFRPRFKLCIAGNHKPQLRSVDEAIRRRFNIIPFNVDVKARFGVNKQLDEELEAEHGGILQWMVEGCLEWQRDGLNPPDCVMAATKDYLDSEDSFGEWLADLCMTGKEGFQASLATLFESWKRYADFNQIKAGDSKSLSALLQSRGFSKTKTKSGVWFTGLRLKPIEQQEVDGTRLHCAC